MENRNYRMENSANTELAELTAPDLTLQLLKCHYAARIIDLGSSLKCAAFHWWWWRGGGGDGGGVGRVNFSLSTANDELWLWPTPTPCSHPTPWLVAVVSRGILRLSLMSSIPSRIDGLSKCLGGISAQTSPLPLWDISLKMCHFFNASWRRRQNSSN